MHTRRLFLSLATLAAVGFAADPVAPVNQNRNRVAIRGYDPVAYFTSSKPTQGRESFTQTWNGAVWRFATQANRDAFAQDPERYAPQFGGYCAYAVSEGYTANIDPQAWTIVDGKLYLNYSKDVQRQWEQDRSRRIQQAERNWPALHR